MAVNIIVEAVVRSAVKVAAVDRPEVVAVAAALDLTLSYSVRFLVFCFISDCKILNTSIKRV